MEYDRIINVHFEVKIMCIKDTSLPESTAVQVHWIRGSQVVETNVKLVTSNKRAYFQQKFSMKTGIKFRGDEPIEQKMTQIKLVRVAEKGVKQNQVVGECEVDLVEYVDRVSE